MLTRALLPDACAVPSAWNALPFVPACTSDICIPFLGVIIHSPKDRALYSLGQTPLRVLSSLPSHHDLSRQQEDLGSERSGWPQVDQLARGHGAAVPWVMAPQTPLQSCVHVLCSQGPCLVCGGGRVLFCLLCVDCQGCDEILPSANPFFFFFLLPSLSCQQTGRRFC